MKVKRESEVAQSCPTPSDPMDCSPPGSSVHGIFQARVLEWGAIAFSMTGGPSKEHETSKPPPTRRVLERSKGDIMCLTTSQNPPRCHPSWLSNACSTRMNSVRMAKDNLEINPIKIKPETASHVAEQFSRVLLPYHSPPRHLSNKIFCLVSSCVSLDNSFPSVRQEPTLRPWKGPPSCKNTTLQRH